MDLAIQTAKEEEADVLCISEPNKGKCEERGWWEDEDRDAAICLINKEIKITEQGKGYGYKWVQVGEYTLYSCYLSPNVSAEREEEFLIELEEDIRRRGRQRIILTGDFNARAESWGDNLTDTRGARFEDWMADNSLIIHNNGTEPTCVRPQGTSRVDLTISSDDIAHRIGKWEILQTPTLSDHRVILCSIEVEQGNITVRKKQDTWKFTGRKKEEFLEIIQNRMEELKTLEAEEMVRQVTNICKQIKPGHRGQQKRRKEVYWWNNEIAEQRKLCLQARRQWTRSRRDEDREQGSNEENYRTFKEEKGKLKKLIQEAKRTKWKELINELEEDIWGEAYTIVVKKLKRGIRRVEAWLQEAGLTLAPEKTEIIMVRGKRQWRGGGINIGGIMLPIKNEAKYLGVWLDHRMKYNIHIEKAAEKTERVINALHRILPNIGGPQTRKRRIISTAAQSIMLYGAEIWAPAMDVQKYRKQLLIRVAAAYRTVSLEALQVISGIPPIDLLARERRDKYVYGETKQQIRARTMRIWEERWSREIKGAWTRELISNVGRWVDRKHGEVGYHFTQWLTGHGSFGKYRRKINKTITAECYHCEQDVEDDPEHTFFRCPRWVDVREGLEREVGNTLRPGNIISIMLETERNWNAIKIGIENIMREKEAEERRRENREQH
ncbi:hypothetical protein NQ315_002694 [Exocentrus adspersus]|uniref:Endonuclease/exonuclease/phosphatase domain-containing protein n=1 Tax=Exocentrus adspersus TaxID=1586481 RepID=A0AAV8VHV7_9CUCU|nr:hypothetical protein NQ315_002694 [Exocentrus adspersus]